VKLDRRKAIYPGTFDPVTFGHIDLIRRALGIFDRVTVAHQSTGKNALFTVKERVQLLEKAVAGLKNVEIESFDGLVVEYARRRGAGSMIRGIRMLSDFEYEFQMALTNRKLAEDIDTVFLMPHENYAYLSSRLIKEVAELGGDIRAFAPDFVVKALQKKLP
jgi:pantetheine-phosphate adenylyltransferase